MNCLFSAFSKKMFAVFLLTLFIGLWSGGLFERYVFNFAFVQSFSAAEARRLNGKTVRETCGRQTGKVKIGKVIGYSRNNYGLVNIIVGWENHETVISTEYPKSSFLRCLEIAE